MSDTYPAIVATEDSPAGLRQLSDDNLPEGDVTVDVSFSSLNYKDGLAVTGEGPHRPPVPHGVRRRPGRHGQRVHRSAMAPGQEVV